ncbi:MAG TPA: PHB depolymerase family esterase [Polyangiaceae bacterium]|jgi:polyhydroxybutyrate depolymerase|nr:PHB depolymerase family esterase [Polyangiaceae bacterium]
MIRLPYQRIALAISPFLVGCSGASAGTSAAPGGTGAIGGDDAQASGGGSSGMNGSSGTGSDGGDDATLPSSSGGASGDGGAAGEVGDAAKGGDGGGSSTPARPSSGCSGGNATSATIDLSFGGMARTYDLHVPAAGTGPRPLVVNLHGYTQSSSSQATLTNMNALADTEGFLVAYPQGVGTPADWNAGACCSAASEGDRDDIGFLDAVIADIESKTCVDLARVYAMGFSNGGMMSYRLACQDATHFAAFASVSGSAAIPLDSTCAPAHPMSLLHVHGNADPLVPYDGGAGGLPLSGRATPVFPAAADEVAAFRTKDGCPSASTVAFSMGNAHCDHWGPCRDGSEVEFCTIDQGGHSWPGGSGVISTEASPLDATSAIWALLKRHALP